MGVAGYQRWGAVLYGVFFLAVLVRNAFGIELEDEAYWVSTYYQIWQGGVPLMSLWDGHTGYFLMVPFFAAYHAAVPSLDGIVLFCRLVSFVLFAGFTGVFFLFMRRGLRRQGRDASPLWLLFVSLPLLFWSGSHLHINYNSGSVWMLVLLCGWYSFCFEDSRRFFFVAGLLAGLACIFYPAMLVLVSALGIAAGIWNYRSRRMQHWLYYLYGGLLVGIIFLAWIFSQGSLAEFEAAIDHILHAPHSAFRGPIDLHFIYRTYVVTIGHFVLRKAYLGLTVVYAAGLLYGRRRLSIDACYRWLPRFFSIYVVLMAWWNRNGYGYAIFGVVVAYFMLMVALRERPWKQVWSFYVIAVLFIAIYSLASDNKNVLLGVDAGKGLLVGGLCTSTYAFWRAHPALGRQVFLILATIAFAGVAHFYLYVYGDAPVLQSFREGRVQDGIYQGICTTDDRKAFLSDMQTVVREEVHPKDKVAVITLEPSVYLMTEARILAPWTFDVQYLFKGFYDDAPLTDYFRAYGTWPDVIVATNRMELSKDILTNEGFRIHEVPGTSYHLVRVADIGDKEIYIWRKNGEAE